MFKKCMVLIQGTLTWVVVVVVGGMWIVQCSSPQSTGSADMRPAASTTPTLTSTADPTSAPTPTYPTPAPTPTSGEPLVHETSSGLACDTDLYADTIYEPNFVAGEGEPEGFVTFEEAVSGWWENRPDRYRDGKDPLFRDAIDNTKVAFRNREGHARLQLYGQQASNGLWNIGRAEFCHAP